MHRLIRFLRNPVRPIKRRVQYAIQKRRYTAAQGYQEEQYWTDRLGKYGLDKRGVGIDARSSEENEAMYADARRVFLDVVAREGIDFSRSRVLEIGCGVGFYTDIVKEQLCPDYTGVDITDALFAELRRRHSNYRFVKGDVTAVPLPTPADVILMIDVTQHIVDDGKFAAAMMNIREHLLPGGVFIVTSWLTPEREQDLFYHVRRPMRLYEQEFPGHSFSEPVPFRDKFLFTIRRPAE
ncbi:MAG: class I SAM-dependent methyltransferase [Candidatus Hydrogenedentes bacterium]|nr:class I SAM-dependent methyltransferase [Candidatus Hydrogenedentota bacterium]